MAHIEKPEERKVYPAIKPRFSLNSDVYLPTLAQMQIDEALTKIKFHRKIYVEWGFGRVDPAGEGIILNFYGKPGTGKTLTAEAFAGTLNRDFISLGMSDIESKFMGETAKNIRFAFESAILQDAVLFFDEADTLLGKRLSSVTQGLDNEVNSLRSTLLIELERFEGIVIFASNFVENYDKAFENRITHHIKFDLPDLTGRKRLWEKFILDSIPCEGREFLIDEAAHISEGLTGRDIRTCMRLALPKVLIESQNRNTSPYLSLIHIESAIAQVKTAHSEIGTEVNQKTEETNAALKMLGVNTKKYENAATNRGIK